MLKWRELFRSHILERDWDYAKEGNVTDLVKTDDSISAVVKGGEHYKVKIRYSGSEMMLMHRLLLMINQMLEPELLIMSF